MAARRRRNAAASAGDARSARRASNDTMSPQRFSRSYRRSSARPAIVEPGAIASTVSYAVIAPAASAICVS